MKLYTVTLHRIVGDDKNVEAPIVTLYADVPTPDDIITAISKLGFLKSDNVATVMRHELTNYPGPERIKQILNEADTLGEWMCVATPTSDGVMCISIQSVDVMML